MKIYLSGPMRGLKDFNFPAFDDGQSFLESLGHKVFSPAQQDRLRGFNLMGRTGHEDVSEFGMNIRETLAMDTEFIALEADAVALLPGWERSNGALAEMYLARAVGIPVGLLEYFDEDGPFREVVLERHTRAIIEAA